MLFLDINIKNHKTGRTLHFHSQVTQESDAVCSWLVAVFHKLGVGCE